MHEAMRETAGIADPRMRVSGGGKDCRKGKDGEAGQSGHCSLLIVCRKGAIAIYASFGAVQGDNRDALLRQTLVSSEGR
jgi:hypothetical protein